MKQPRLAELPEPELKAQEHSANLVKHINQMCAMQGGSISFSEYMQQCLYAPGLGYYTGGLQKFGEKGDFITAPEVSPLFSQCLAHQYAQVLATMTAPDVLEFGAGSGVMAADSLLELEVLDSLPEHYYIVELSVDLKQRQQATISEKAPHLIDRVQWFDALPEKPLTAVVVANEVLDAMPVECFRISEDNVELMRVASIDDALEVQYKIADADNTNIVRTIEKRREKTFPSTYCSEFNPALTPWLQSLSDTLEQGVVFLIDYGYAVSEYYRDERNMGTLMCHYQHRAHNDVFWYPGLQDITAFVDFTAVAYAAVEAGFDVSGYAPQADFLVSSGLADLHQRHDDADTQKQLLLSQQIKTLTLPSEMGERFKVMALSKNFHEDLLGFGLQDYRNRL